MSQNSMRMQRGRGRGRGKGNGLWLMTTLMLILWLGVGLDLLPLAAAGSCREAQLCCNGRDSSCVVQKAPVNAIIEDLSDKPCYCDHACLKLGDCCDDFKDHCGVLDCQVGDWGAWSECDKSCGAGMMTRTRQILQAAQNGGKHCPSMLQKRGCQGYRCHGHRDKKILREMALLLPAALTHNRNYNRVNESDKNDLRRNLRTRYRDTFKHIRDHEYCVEFEVIKASKACHKLPPYNLMLEGDRITVRCDLEALVQDKETGAGKQQSGSKAAAAATTTTTTTTTTTAATHKSYLNAEDVGGGLGDESSNNSGNNNGDDENDEDEEEEEQEQEPEQEPGQDQDEEDEETNDEDDAQNMLDTETDANAERGSNESYEYNKRQQLRQSHRQRSTTSKRSTNNKAQAPISPLALQQQQQQQLLMSHHCRGEGLSGRTTRWSALPAPSCRGKWLRLTIGPPKKCNHAQFIFV